MLRSSSSLPVLLFATLATIGSLLPAKGEEPFRDWKGSNGRGLIGQLLWAQDDFIYIKSKKTGRMTKIALTNVSLADQFYVKEFLQKAASKKIVYQFQLAGERFVKKQIGTIPDQKRGQFFIDGNQGKGSLYWTFEPTAPIKDSLLSEKATLHLSVGSGKNDGTKKQVQIVKSGRVISTRSGLKKGGRHQFHIPLSALLSSPSAGTIDPVIELRIVVPHQDGVRVLGRTSANPPTLNIYDPKVSK